MSNIATFTNPLSYNDAESKTITIEQNDSKTGFVIRIEYSTAKGYTNCMELSNSELDSIHRIAQVFINY